MSPLAIAPIFPELMNDFNSDLAGVVQFTGVTIIVLGFANFLWYAFGWVGQQAEINQTARIPLSSTFGRRFVLLASTLVTLGSCIWRAKARSYESFLGAAAFSGIGCGAGEVGYSVRRNIFEQAAHS